MSAEIQPTRENGLPVCSRESCPTFDGKRCRALGLRPAYHCEPALIEDRRVREELLTACKGALAYMEERGRYDTVERAAPLREAISKAEGRS